MENINKRRSIRTFTGEKVETEKIDKILRAGMQAPSAFNQQAWEFVVVTDEIVLEKVSNVSPKAKVAKDAGVAIVTLINRNNLKSELLVDQDLSACTQNMLLEAVAQGLGAFWIGIKPLDERMNIISKILDLPENIEPFSLIVVGYSDEENIFIDRYVQEKIHYNKY